MMKNFLYYTTDLVLIISLISLVLIWPAMMYVGIKEYYDINPNSLFIIIPFVIFVHVFGYLCFTRK